MKLKPIAGTTEEKEMRSNTQNTNSNQAAKIMRQTKMPTMKKIGIEIIKATRKAIGLLTFGITAKQWTASLMICAMMSPVFALPVRAALLTNDYNASIEPANKFEPVNPPEPVWKQMWMDMNAKTRAWLTPLREGSRSYKDFGDKIAGDEDKLKKTDKKQDNSESVGENINSESPAAKADLTAEDADKSVEAANANGKEENVAPVSTTEKTPGKTESANSKTKILANTARTAVALLVSQLPADEQASLYSPQNNLGAPTGQTEMDSPNQASATRIRHRAGIANFSFGVPLASLSGRGIDAAVGMTYNSRTWNKYCIAYDTSGACNQNHFTYDVEQSWIAPGFSSGFGHLDTRATLQYIHPPQSSNFQYYTEIVPVGITDPDGTRHQVGCTSFSPIPNSYSYRCDGYATSDGSFIRIPAQPWTANANNSQNLNTSNYRNVSFITSYPNGSKVWYSGGFGSDTSRKHYPLILQDSNGNRIKIAYKADQSGRIDYITDTLNRNIKFYYETDAAGNPDKLVAVTIPGLNTGDELQTVRFYYEDINLAYADKFAAGSEVVAPASIRVLRYVYFPSTKSGFKYDYHPSFGMITKISRQVGMSVSDTSAMTTTGSVTNEGAWAATTEYNFQSGTPALSDVPKYTKRTDDWQGRTSAAAMETFYDVPEPVAGQDNVSTITVKDKNFDSASWTYTNFDTNNKTVSYNTNDWMNGLVKETSIIKVFGPSGQYRTTMAKTKYFWEQGQSAAGARQNPILRKLEVTNDAGLTRATQFEHDQYNNQTAVENYDYAAPGSLGTLLRRTETAYETRAGWISANLLSLPVSVQTKVGGVTVSKTLMEYDHNGSDATMTRRSDIDVGTHDTFYNPDHPAYTETVCPDGTTSESPASGGNAPLRSIDGCVNIYHPGYGPASAYRGNLTRAAGLIDINATDAQNDPNADVSNREYDIAGNIVSATLSCCQLKTIDYDKANEYAFPVTERKGGSPTQLTTSATYNRSTGLVLTSTDENGQVTNYDYEQDTLRPHQVTYPNNSYTLTEYIDKLASNPNDMVVGFMRQTRTLEANKTVESYSYFDGRGAPIRNATQTPDGWSVSAVEYDALGRAKRSYNPFYAVTPTGAISANTPYTEVLNTDALGRTIQIRLQDGTTTAPTVFGNSSTTPVGFNKTFVTVTDQGGKQRRQIIDALGRIVRVDEPDAAGNLGAVEAPIQPTAYEYDGNNNLSKITQSMVDQQGQTTTQERRFKYDSLLRLISEKQVEATATLNDAGTYVGASGQWTKVLKYDTHGHITDGWDARGVRTQYGYDGLNRVKTVIFSDGTPNITYTYDQTRAGFFNKGALTRAETAPNNINPRADTPDTAAEFDYDQMGNVKGQRQSIGTQTYNLEYGYNLAGQLTSEKYPSGKVVAMGYDAGGRLSNIADNARTYLNSLQYQGKGNTLSSMSLGNGTTQSFAMNDRLQMSGQQLQRGSEILQKYDYGYGQIDGSGNLDLTKNNGQLAKVDSYIGASKQWTENFSYDSIGRLSESKEYRGDNGALSYKQTFDFDRFGNMYRKNASNQAAGQQNPLPFNSIEDGDISKSTNRFTTNTAYDEAGNVIQDNKFRSMNFAYDANGRMFRTSNTDNSNQANSVYDASGQRVATQVDGVWTFMVYDAMGKMIAEYGGLQSSGEGGVKYVMQDWQGSTRAIVNNAGVVQSRTDYTAFGEEISGGVGQRTTAQGFSGNNNLSQKYAQTERDKATGLDHTGFRKNENRAGRWTSPDPYNGSMSLGNPQSFNRYSYVQNDPVNNVDPSGLDMSMCSAEYSYGSCGGDDAFWGGRSNGGGGFGGGYADYNQTYGGLPAEAAQGLADHLERVNNSIYGNGFRTAAEIAGGALATVTVHGAYPFFVFDAIHYIWRGGEQDPIQILANAMNSRYDASMNIVGGMMIADGIIIAPLLFPEGGLISLGLSDGATSILPTLSDKLKYLFGKATGSAHNVQRSMDMERQLSRIGIHDDAAGNAYMRGRLGDAYNNSSGILQSNGRIMRESLVTGPNGILKMQSIWEGSKLITVELFGK